MSPSNFTSREEVRAVINFFEGTIKDILNNLRYSPEAIGETSQLSANKKREMGRDINRETKEVINSLIDKLIESNIDTADKLYNYLEETPQEEIDKLFEETCVEIVERGNEDE